jgi:hypothetical protein
VDFFNISVCFWVCPPWILMQLLRKIENALHKALHFPNVKNSAWKLLVLRLCSSTEMINLQQIYSWIRIEVFKSDYSCYGWYFNSFSYKNLGRLQRSKLKTVNNFENIAKLSFQCSLSLSLLVYSKRQYINE